MVVIDWTLNIGVIIQILTIAAAALVFVLSVKSDVSKVKGDIIDIKSELKELRNVLTTQVNHDGRLERLEQDYRDLRGELRELRHGEGFVLPIGTKK